MRAKGFIVLVGVLLMGVVAAWPFRQGPQAPEPADADLVDVPLRRPEAPLEALPPSRISPAVDLAAMDVEPGDLVPDHTDIPEWDSTAERTGLDALATTPYLPDGFGRLTAHAQNQHAPGQGLAGPAAGAAQGRNWHPVRLKLPTPKALRRHRITDGDSLESLAQRYLGRPERAAEIYALNGDILTAPDLLPLGRIIRIPAEE